MDRQVQQICRFVALWQARNIRHHSTNNRCDNFIQVLHVAICGIFAKFVQLFGTCPRIIATGFSQIALVMLGKSDREKLFLLTCCAHEKSGWRAGGESDLSDFLCSKLSQTQAQLGRPFAKDELGRVWNQSGLTGNLCYHRLCEMAQAGSNWTLGCSTMVSHGLIEFNNSKGPMKHVETDGRNLQEWFGTIKGYLRIFKG